MENEGVSLSQPVIEFPVGLALLLILLLCMSALMSLCFHWDKFRCLRHSTGDHTSNTQSQIPHSPPKSVPPHMWKQNQSPSLPVLMPGDEAPKFIAIPCPNFQGHSKSGEAARLPSTAALAHMYEYDIPPNLP